MALGEEIVSQAITKLGRGEGVAHTASHLLHVKAGPGEMFGERERGGSGKMYATQRIPLQQVEGVRTAEGASVVEIGVKGGGGPVMVRVDEFEMTELTNLMQSLADRKSVV